MTTKHAPTAHWLLWCDHCGFMAPPRRVRIAQWALALAAGWNFGLKDCCPGCRSKHLKDLPGALDRSSLNANEATNE